MLREEISSALKSAMKAKKSECVSTIRLILAAIKDRDIASRTGGDSDGISDDEIMKVLQTMVKQRQESIKMYEQGGRPELAKQEADEIVIIQEFLPEQLSEEEIAAIVNAAIEELGAESLKDMGRMMAHLRENHAGSMDFGKASGILKQRLGGA
ncbi:MAG: glutamyl-tRNA amidotransferase [Rhodospirillaceae bacterium]|nr:glutamyl-tRNA amidotransferase [Rhodospirillaceae bacterium]|tara:strand:- start:2815 stop:3276 length:462 start_codon:yes stop_codon:yes gene_type:complete